MGQPLVKEFVSSTLEVAIAEMEGTEHGSHELHQAQVRAKEALFWYEKHLEEIQKRCQNQAQPCHDGLDRK